MLCGVSIIPQHADLVQWAQEVRDADPQVQFKAVQNIRKVLAIGTLDMACRHEPVCAVIVRELPSN